MIEDKSDQSESVFSENKEEDEKEIQVPDTFVSRAETTRLQILKNYIKDQIDQQQSSKKKKVKSKNPSVHFSEDEEADSSDHEKSETDVAEEVEESSEEESVRSITPPPVKRRKATPVKTPTKKKVASKGVSRIQPKKLIFV